MTKSYSRLIAPALASVLASVLALWVTGCVTEQQLADEDAPDFPVNVGQDPLPESVDASSYAGPYGFVTGAVIPNFRFLGHADFSNPDLIGLQEVQLSHFSNPTGSEVFGAESVYGPNAAKPKAIVLMMSSVWCGPCQYEAGTVLPVEVPKYPAVKFVATLIDGPEQGTPATLRDLGNWAERYSPTYPLLIDPSSQITPLYGASYPGNMIIRTSDMRIMYRLQGVMEHVDDPRGEYEDFWEVLDKVVAGTYEPAVL